MNLDAPRIRPRDSFIAWSAAFLRSAKTFGPVVFLCLYWSAPASAQSVSPVIASGRVFVDLRSAHLEGKVCLTHRTADADAHFVLNHGLNIARIYDDSGHDLRFEGSYNPQVNGEGLVYEVQSPVPAKFCVDYVGSFPSYPKHDGPPDFKGIIAFDGASMRAAEQAAWLPMPFDVDRKSRVDLAYDLEISCRGCRFIYMNGLAPRSVSHGRFSSVVARAPLIFVGTGPWVSLSNVTFVNERPTPSQSARIAAVFGAIEHFYSSYLDRPLDDKPTLLRMLTTDQVDRNREGSSWGFASWPTIALSGSIGTIAETLGTQNSKIPYLAHETAHYYFGTLNHARGPYQWMLTESMAEFLAIEADAALEGDAAQQHYLSSRLGQFAGEKSFVPLDKITDPSQIGGVYRYRYIPMLLVALERRVGDTAMRSFVRTLFNAPSPKTWKDFHRLAISSGITEAQWDGWYHHCVESGDMTCPNEVGGAR